ncbi:MAG: hypothetical protein E7173_02620 [Firmicutes bacterium]|nr:hypothetical protein [Bacillota bacterium]
MRKIIGFIIVCLLTCFFSEQVIASDLGQARIGSKFYNTLEDAIIAASSNDIINLNNDVSLDNSIEINKTVNINLNGHSISTEEKVFVVQGGSLNLTGKGNIYETRPNYGAIMIIGADDSSKTDYSTVSIGKDILLEGWSGIFINHLNKTGYGIRINMAGSINAVNDASGDPGIGIYVNGNIQNKQNAPMVHLTDTAKIASSGHGIYAAGYATYKINGADIAGHEAGIGIKAGVFNILNGTIIGNGEDQTPTTGNNNGINASGAAIQIESNQAYPGNIEINIENGFFNSKNSNVIYEYTVNNTQTKVNSLTISGGKYISDKNADVFNLSDDLSNKFNFISGGIFSSNPEKFVKSGYKVLTNKENLYDVVKNSISVFYEIENNNHNINFPLVTIILIIIFTVIIFILSKKFNLISILTKK